MTQVSPHTNVRFGPFDVDLLTGEVRKHGVRLRLAGQPFRILTLLLERPGELITREEIRSKLWAPDTYVDFDHSLNAALNKLRDALGDAADNPRYIETLPRRGYRLIVPVEPVSGPRPMNLAQATVEAELEGSAVPRPDAGSSRLPIWAMVVVAALAAIGIFIVFGNRIGALGLKWPVSSQSTAPQIRSVAVLPFENLSKDPEQEYFADGMTEELISQLARFSALRVTSRTSVMQYKGARKPLREIAAALGVDAVIEGTVRREGNHVRISAQLIEAQSDHHLWAETFERELSGVLALQIELAGRIAEKVRVEASPQEQQWLRAARAAAPPDEDAYQLYLRGLHALKDSSKKGRHQAAAFFGEAIARDERFAPAWAARAELALFATPPLGAMQEARRAAQRALELNPQSPEAHYVLGLVQTVGDWDWKAGEASFRKALQLNPSHAQARHRYAYNLNAQGRVSEALAQIDRALEIDPFSEEIAAYRGRTLFFARRFDEARAALRKATEMNPNYFWAHFFLAITEEHTGRYDEAIEHYARAYSSVGASPEFTQHAREVYRTEGYPGILRLRLRPVMEGAERGELNSAAIAFILLRLGEKEKAIRWLEKVFDSHTTDLIYLNIDPQYDPIRADPRFQALVRRVGLPSPTTFLAQPASSQVK